MPSAKPAVANTNITHLYSEPTSPTELDAVLYQQITKYVDKHSWRQLAREIKEFVNDQYKPAFARVADGTITPEELEKEIKSYVPSRAYIEDYVKGRPICYRYTNTLANFFRQSYVLKNHDPCSEFLVKLKSA